mgnify:CR=1 FL=1
MSSLVLRVPGPAICAPGVLRLDRRALRGGRRIRLGLRRPQFCFPSSACSLRGSMPAQHGAAPRIPPHPRWGVFVCWRYARLSLLCFYVLLSCMVVWSFLVGRSFHQCTQRSRWIRLVGCAVLFVLWSVVLAASPAAVSVAGRLDTYGVVFVLAVSVRMFLYLHAPDRVVCHVCCVTAGSVLGPGARLQIKCRCCVTCQHMQQPQPHGLH